MSYIISLGTALPPYSSRQADIAQFMIKLNKLNDSEARKLKILYEKTLIDTRYSVIPDFQPDNEGPILFNKPQDHVAIPNINRRMDVYNEKALPLAEKAITDCFNNVPNMMLDAVTHLITVTCTGLAAPGLEIALMEKLGLRSDIVRFGINFIGCYAAFHALKLADAFCKADPQNVVLIVCVELCSIHFQEGKEKDELLANALFGDGSAAVLMCGIADRSSPKISIKGFFTELNNKGKHDMSWQLGQTGFLMKLTSYVPELIESALKPMTEKIFQRSKQEQTAINHWAIHPGGRKILEKFGEALGLTERNLSASYRTLAKYGNMSAPTILFVLKDLWDNDIDWAKPEKIFAAGFGPGLTLESALLEVETL